MRKKVFTIMAAMGFVLCNVRGIHDLFFVFKGEKDLFNFDWWQFNK
jgi:hypothetical protein